MLNPAFIMASSATMLTRITYIYNKVSSVISQAHLRRLSPLIFPHDVLQAVKDTLTNLLYNVNLFLLFITFLIYTNSKLPLFTIHTT